MTLDALNASPLAEREFLRCCGSTRWARLMAAARPFASAEAMAATADVLWSSLADADWREAFASHPKIGAAVGSGAAGESSWPAGEQRGVSTAGPDVLARLDTVNRAYEERFGYIFIVCATGKSAEEMLALAERRMTHDPADELRIAAEEQRNITRLRLAKLLAS